MQRELELMFLRRFEHDLVWLTWSAPRARSARGRSGKRRAEDVSLWRLVPRRLRRVTTAEAGEACARS